MCLGSIFLDIKKIFLDVKKSNFLILHYIGPSEIEIEIEIEFHFLGEDIG